MLHSTFHYIAMDIAWINSNIYDKTPENKAKKKYLNKFCTAVLNNKYSITEINKILDNFLQKLDHATLLNFFALKSKYGIQDLDVMILNMQITALEKVEGKVKPELIEGKRRQILNLTRNNPRLTHVYAYACEQFKVK